MSNIDKHDLSDTEIEDLATYVTDPGTEPVRDEDGEVVFTENGDPRLSDPQTVNDALSDVADMLLDAEASQGNALARLDGLIAGTPSGDGDAQIISHAREAIKQTGLFGKPDSTIEDLPDLLTLDEDGSLYSFRVTPEATKCFVIRSYTGRWTEPSELVAVHDTNFDSQVMPEEWIKLAKRDLFNDATPGDDPVRDDRGFVILRDRKQVPGFIDACKQYVHETQALDESDEQDRLLWRQFAAQLHDAEPDEIVQVAHMNGLCPPVVPHGMVRSVNRRAITGVGIASIETAQSVSEMAQKCNAVRPLGMSGSLSGGGNPKLRGLTQALNEQFGWQD